ncbi:putative AbiEi antitoxin of type IV toxin-antitoxin system [Kribbella amoyensis]|uniref:Putative AbiEi antitoxin of type IV toxin-antitoxin system n=1 Tax=Kribbella amoyensis TaxID=996641 RepID=A0A561BL13_9ACTN|nr:type IV toxin-antitoxin system AbiEi family antitoxin domain-containing protein [Kribbella amoyensis]TWD79558.1 putative AbiEi antitoxin of type IV toxin-antitoxin system [Kribbella amoyensis]
MGSVAEVLAHGHGYATFRQLVAATSRRAVATAVERGEIERLAHGIYILPGLSSDWLTALAYDGVLSHQSAAARWGLPLLVTPPKPHLILPPKRHPRPGRPAVLHWAETTAEERRARLTGLARTVVDCARVLPFGEALAVADAALADGRCGQEELISATEAMRGPGRPNASLVARSATGLAGSFLESMLRALLITEQISGFEPQVHCAAGSRAEPCRSTGCGCRLSPPSGVIRRPACPCPGTPPVDLHL